MLCFARFGTNCKIQKRGKQCEGVLLLVKLQAK